MEGEFDYCIITISKIADINRLSKRLKEKELVPYKK